MFLYAIILPSYEFSKWVYKDNTIHSMVPFETFKNKIAHGPREAYKAREHPTFF